MNRLSRIAVAALVATVMITPVTAATPEPGGNIFVFAADWLNPEGYWIENTNNPYPGCDTEGTGASDGYVRCAFSEPGDSPDPAYAFDPQTAHAPVSILD